MRSIGATGFAALGAGLIAITYGLARYAYGLFVPAIREELGLSSEVVGIVGSMAFVSFCLASVVAPFAADRLGARYAATLSGAFAFAGLTLISQAQDARILGVGVFACGLSTGLMMPALSAGVQVVVRRSLHGRVNAVMNAGTSIGLMLCIPAFLFLTGEWRAAYISFAALAALGLVAAISLIPSAARVDRHLAAPTVPLTGDEWFALIRLTLFCFTTGVAATAYWIFAPDLVVEVGDLPGQLTGWLWLVVGIAGLTGAWVSDLSDRLGAPGTQALALLALGAATALVASGPGQLWIALVSAAVFGWAFMSLSGLYLVSGIRLLRERPSMGPVVPFLAITVGQAVGSPLAGWIIARTDYVEAFAMFATLAILLAALSFFYPRPPAGAVPEDLTALPSPSSTVEAVAMNEDQPNPQSTEATT